MIIAHSPASVGAEVIRQLLQRLTVLTQREGIFLYETVLIGD
jgi:hypothetical protein